VTVKVQHFVLRMTGDSRLEGKTYSTRDLPPVFEPADGVFFLSSESDNCLRFGRTGFWEKLSDGTNAAVYWPMPLSTVNPS
jgi:hypothetical protein